MKLTNAMKTATINEQDHTVTIDGRVFRIGEEVTPKPTPEERLLQLLEGAIRKHDFELYPYTAAFWIKDDEVIMEERKNGELWVSSENIWSVFETEYGMSHNEIRALIANSVAEHFNCKGVTPQEEPFVRQKEVAEHFNMKNPKKQTP